MVGAVRDQLRRLELVHGLVVPAGSGGHHRRHRLRFRTFFTVFLNLTTNFPDTTGWILTVYGWSIVHGRPNSFGCGSFVPVGRERVVAHLGGAHHRGGAVLRPEPPRVRLLVFKKFEYQSTLGVPLFVFMMDF